MLGILPGTIGLIQATETVKLILGIGEPLVGRLLLYDALAMRFRELKLRKNPECPVCGEHRTITRLIDYQQFCGVPRTQETKVTESEIDVTEVKAKLDRGDHFVLIDVREPHEYRICNIPAARLIPLGEVPKTPERVRPRRRYRDPLPQRRAQRQSLRHPAPGRFSARPQHEGRHPRLGRQGGSQRAEVLISSPCAR